MRCPHCKRVVPENMIYCPECGLAVSSKRKHGTETVDNWSNSKDIFKSYDDAIKDASKNYKSARRSNSKKNLPVILIMCVLIAAYSLFVVYRYRQNAMVLNAATESIVGKTYDDCDAFALNHGWDYERVIAEVVDHDTLKYTRGKYTFRILENTEESFKTGWDLVHVYEETEYPYEIHISFLGKVTIEIDGEKYLIELTDTNEVDDIEFYD